MKAYHKKIEELFRKVFQVKPDFESLGIEEIGHDYCHGIKDLLRAD